MDSDEDLYYDDDDGGNDGEWQDEVEDDDPLPSAERPLEFSVSNDGERRRRIEQ